MGTLIGFCLDESGSMASLYQQTLDGFNTYLDELRTQGHGDAQFTLMKFEGENRVILHDNVALVNVPNLDKNTYRPAGGTPLIDAAMEMIYRVDKHIKEHDALLPPAVIIVIQTDGQENQSRQYNWQQLKQEIEIRKAEDWQFVFLGANINAYAQAQRMGVDVASTVSYAGTKTRETFRTTAQATASFLSGQSETVAYSDETKKELGDTKFLGYKE